MKGGVLEMCYGRGRSEILAFERKGSLQYHIYIYLSRGDMMESCDRDSRSAIGPHLIIAQGHSVSTPCVSLP